MSWQSTYYFSNINLSRCKNDYSWKMLPKIFVVLSIFPFLGDSRVVNKNFRRVRQNPNGDDKCDNFYDTACQEINYQNKFENLTQTNIDVLAKTIYNDTYFAQQVNIFLNHKIYCKVYYSFFYRK